MDLVIEAIEEGPSGPASVSVTHYGEQNGDLMRDPEMCFELRDGELDPWYYRNDYVGVEQWSRNNLRGQYVFLVLMHQQHQRFAKTWDNHLRCQGFAEAYDPEQLVRG